MRLLTNSTSVFYDRVLQSLLVVLCLHYFVIAVLLKLMALIVRVIGFNFMCLDINRSYFIVRLKMGTCVGNYNKF